MLPSVSRITIDIPIYQKDIDGCYYMAYYLLTEWKMDTLKTFIQELRKP